MTTVPTLLVMCCQHMGATTPKLHGAHLAVALPLAISDRKMMGGACGLPHLSRSGKAPRRLEPRSLDSESRVLAVTPRGQLSLLGTAGRKLPDSMAKRAGGPGGRTGRLPRCVFEALTLVVGVTANIMMCKCSHAGLNRGPYGY
jgi:hypothetical protein